MATSIDIEVPWWERPPPRQCARVPYHDLEEDLNGHGPFCDESYVAKARAKKKLLESGWIVDLQYQWQQVAGHVCVAAFCLIPVAGLPIAVWLSVKFILWRVSRTTGTLTLFSRSVGKLMLDIIFWLSILVLLGGNIVIIFRLYRNSRALNSEQRNQVDLREDLLTLQRTLLRDTLYIVSGVARIILDFHSGELEDQLIVLHHNDGGLGAEGELEDQLIVQNQNAALGAEGQVLTFLKTRFPSLYRTRRTRKKVAQFRGALNWCLLAMSSCAAGFGVLILAIVDCQSTSNCNREQLRSFGPFEQLPTSAAFWLPNLTMACAISTNWFLLIRNCLKTAEQMENNHDQLLVYTALTNPPDEFYTMWSSVTRKTLISIMYAAYQDTFTEGEVVLKTFPQFKEEVEVNGVIGQLAWLFERWQDQRGGLDHALDTDAVRARPRPGSCCLNLADTADLQAWWDLRKYMQMDFLEATFLAESVSVIVLMMFVLFVLVGILDLVAKRDHGSPGMVLLALLGFALFVIVCRFFNAAIAINSLWDNDNRVLTMTALNIAMRSEEFDSRLPCLRAMQQKVDVFDNRQALFGIVVTRGMRNGWVVSGLGLGLSYLVQSARSGLSILLALEPDQLDDFVHNLTRSD